VTLKAPRGCELHVNRERPGEGWEQALCLVPRPCGIEQLDLCNTSLSGPLTSFLLENLLLVGLLDKGHFFLTWPDVSCSWLRTSASSVVSPMCTG
jgi:hypothetical protein